MNERFGSSLFRRDEIESFFVGGSARPEKLHAATSSAYWSTACLLYHAPLRSGGLHNMARKSRWDRSNYPDDWEEISRNKREEAGWACEFCGVVHGGEGCKRNGGTYSPVRVAAAHKWPNDTHNPNPDLYCLCQSCHRTYDNQFQDIIAEGEHQAQMHEILLNANGLETVYCSHPECEGYFLPHEH